MRRPITPSSQQTSEEPEAANKRQGRYRVKRSARIFREGDFSSRIPNSARTICAGESYTKDGAGLQETSVDCGRLDQNDFVLSIGVIAERLSGLVEVFLESGEDVSDLFRAAQIRHGVGDGIVVLQPEQRGQLLLVQFLHAHLDI